MKQNIVILPVYNEYKYLADVLNEVKKYINYKTTDVLVIDDGSNKTTQNILKKFKSLKIIRHNKNQGYGRSLIDSFNYAIKKRYKILVSIDADCQHQPKMINKFISLARNTNTDIISGSRYLISNSDIRNVPKDRLKINKIITEKLNEITNYNLTDAFCGFKAYKVDSLKLLKLKEKSYGMPLELLLNAYINNLKIKEIPVDLIYLDKNRSFKGFASPEKRLKYYESIINAMRKEISAFKS